jgi:hypothetical protein
MKMVPCRCCRASERPSSAHAQKRCRGSVPAPSSARDRVLPEIELPTHPTIN